MSRKRKRDNQPRKPALSKCRDCGTEQTVARWLYFRAAPPRCQRCGGLLDYTGTWKGTRNSPKVVFARKRGPKENQQRSPTR